MRQILFVIYFTIFVTMDLAFAQIPRVGPPLPFVLPMSVEESSPAPKAAGEGGVNWLLWDDQVSVADQARYHRQVIEITSVAGLESSSELSVEFDPEYQTLIAHHLRILREGKTIENLGRIQPSIMQRESQWDRRMLDGRLTALYVLQDVRLGDRIDWSYTLKGNNPVFLSKMSGWQYLAHASPTQRRHVRLVAPENRLLNIKRHGGAAAYKSQAQNGQIEFVWDLRQVPAVAYENGAPSWHPFYPRIEWSEYRSWSDVVNWAKTIYRQTEPLSQEMQERIADLRKLKPEDRVRESLRFVQDSIRYLGMEMGASSHAPRPPDSVLVRRFGDCKEKVLLFCTLLGRTGMQAEPVLVNTEAGPTLSMMNPAPMAFDHVIARVKLDGQFQYYDPTITGQRGRPSRFDAPPYQGGLPIADDVYGPIDFLPEGHSNLRVDYDVTIPDWKKGTRMSITTVYSGHEADRVRREWGANSYAELEKSYRKFNGRMYGGLRNIDSVRYSEDPVTGEVTTREIYAIDSLCELDANTGRRECSFAPLELSSLLNAPELETRNSPYALDWPKKVQAVMRLHLPEDMGRLHSNGRTALPEAIITWDENGRNREHTLSYTYESLSDHVPQEGYAKYVSALKSINEEFGVTYTMQAMSQAGYFGSHLNFFWLLYLVACLAAATWCFKRILRMEPLKVHRLESPDGLIGETVPANGAPRSLGGWLYLVGFGLLAGLIYRTWNLKDLLSYLNGDTWEQLTSSTGRAFHMGWEPLLIFEAFSQITGLGALVACVFLFLKRQRNFPKVYVVVITSLIGFDLLDTGLIFLAGMQDLVEVGKKDLLETLSNSITASLWILYMFNSVRVRKTFLHPLH